jgi:hypothetical protein
MTTIKYAVLLLNILWCNALFKTRYQPRARNSSLISNCRQGKMWATYAVSNKETLLSRNTNAPFYELDSWFQRMGNNFIQIKRALRYAICCNARLEIKHQNIWMPSLHQYMDFSSVPAYRMDRSYKPPHYCSKNRSESFFTVTPDFPMPECQYDEYSALQYFIFDNEYSYGCPSPLQKCPPMLENGLVVHFRSGDIFNDKSPPTTPMNMYRQPPLAYYKEIFTQKKWPRIILLTSMEDTNAYNPVWTYLTDHGNLKKSINLTETLVSFQLASTVQDTLKVLLCARHFVASSSTFANMVVHVSPALKEIFAVEDSIFGSCSRYPRIAAHNIVCKERSLPGYEMTSFDWTNSKAQREAMITYSLKGGV